MGFTNSPLVSYTQISPNRNTPRNQPITKITVHHMAGIMSVEQFGALVANPARQMSANYCIGSDGRIGLFCPESDRSWCSGSAWNDNRSITIEVSNDVYGEPWSISQTVYASLIRLCVDICKRNGIKKLEFTGDKNGSLTYHYMFQATQCPATWIKGHTQEICDKVNAQLNEVAGLYTKTLTSGTPIYKEIGKPATGKIEVATKYTIVEEKVVDYVKYGKLKSGAGWVELEKNVPTKSTVSNSSPNIKGLQTILNKGGANLVVDGILGIKTLTAVKKYSIKNGDTGNLIKWVQERLNQLDYNCGICDGEAGVKTMNAIYKWQKANNLGVGDLYGSDWNVLLKG